MTVEFSRKSAEGKLKLIRKFKARLNKSCFDFKVYYVVYSTKVSF